MFSTAELTTGAWLGSMGFTTGSAVGASLCEVVLLVVSIVFPTVKLQVVLLSADG
jgi:hypothetical protein